MLDPVMSEDLRLLHRAMGRRREFEEAAIVVTGCAGFIGFYLLQYLVRYAGELGIRRIIGLDVFRQGRPNWLGALCADFPDVLEIRKFDIAQDEVGNVEGAAGAHFVVHMASIASPSFYRQFPLETIDANVWGLRRLLDYYKGSERLRGFLFLSSSEIYGDPEPASIPTDEEYRGRVACLGPRSCYDEAKRFGETLCYTYSKIHGLPITLARPFNNYGPGMRLDDRRLPADFAKCVLEGRDISILSDGSPTRTFCYISDAIAGYLKCLLHGAFDVFNIGIEAPEVSVRDFAEIYRSAAIELFGYRGEVKLEHSADADYLTDNPSRRCPVIAKARAKLGYDPRILAEEGVRRYLQFLRFEQGARP
jgi:UDP-glucuronate decarboxylase